MLKAWILATRPKTLSAAVVPVLMATALASHKPTGVVWWAAACALFGALLIQVATNFINDALDFKKGADTQERLGPLRVTQAGLISADAVMNAAYACLVGTLIFGIPLLDRGGWPMLAIGLASVAGAYLYTGGPFPLAYHGLGEIFVLLFFGLAAVCGTFYVQTLQMDVVAVAAGIIAGSLATVLLVINNLRDVNQDRVSRKKTTVVRFGERFARAEIVLFALLPFAIAAWIAWSAALPWVLLVLLALPLALALLIRVFKSEGAALNRCLAMAGGLQWIFGILFTIGASLR